jgi:hypothetical protein
LIGGRRRARIVRAAAVAGGARATASGVHYDTAAVARGARFRRSGDRAARATLRSRAMADTGKIAKNLERFAQAVAAHDRENPTHTAHGIGLAHFDLERLGFEEGEEILPGITIHADSGVTGNFRVLCDGQHDEEREESEREVVEAIATQAVPAAAPAAPRFRPFGE